MPGSCVAYTIAPYSVHQVTQAFDVSFPRAFYDLFAEIPVRRMRRPILCNRCASSVTALSRYAHGAGARTWAGQIRPLRGSAGGCTTRRRYVRARARAPCPSPFRTVARSDCGISAEILGRTNRDRITCTTELERSLSTTSSRRVEKKPMGSCRGQVSL